MANLTRTATVHTATSPVPTGLAALAISQRIKSAMVSVATIMTRTIPSLLHPTTGSTALEWKLERLMKCTGHIRQLGHAEPSTSTRHPSMMVSSATLIWTHSSLSASKTLLPT
eukprot:185055_1